MTTLPRSVATSNSSPMTRIVTSTYRYKRPTRKRKTVTPGGPAIVTTRTPPVDQSVDAPEPTAPPPANDDSLTEPAPRPSARKSSAIVTTTNWKRAMEPDDDPEAVARVKAFFARMIRPPGQ